MTLHWWMHWFWVTAQIAGILANPLPSTTQDLKIPESLGESTVNSNSRNDRVSTMTDPRSTTNETIDETLINPSKNEARVSSNGSSFRVAKAINSHDSPTKTNTAIANNNNNDNLANEETTDIEITTRGESTPVIDHLTERNFRDNFQRTLRKNRGSMFKGDDEDLRTNGDSSTISNEPDSRITWLLTTNKTPDRRRKKNEDLTSRVNVMKNFSNVKLDNDNEHDNNNDNNNNNSDNENNDDLTVLPLRIEGARFKLVLNSTHTITANSADGFSTRTFNGSEDIEIDQELAEPRLSATAASIIQAGISESTRLSRARNAFTSDFQRDHREGDLTSGIDVNRVIVEGNESINREIEKSSSSPSLIDIAAITGSCLATIVILSTMASLGFIMYRRKYLNPPQTLNSDKCSNPDSSGYIDDSTIRDNSEEMYSLDNDSFLNSLEAMTIQNYWTDSVKHTKL